MGAKMSSGFGSCLTTATPWVSITCLGRADEIPKKVETAIDVCLYIFPLILHPHRAIERAGCFTSIT